MGIGLTGHDPGAYAVAKSIDNFPVSWVIFATEGAFKHGVRVSNGLGVSLSYGDYLGLSWSMDGIEYYYNGLLYDTWAVKGSLDTDLVSNTSIEELLARPLWVVIILNGVCQATTIEAYPFGLFLSSLVMVKLIIFLYKCIAILSIYV